LRDQEDELVRLNVKVVVVTFENDFLARCYIEDTALDWPVLIDSTRAVYRYFGMLAASFWDVWGLKTWLVYAKEFLHGNRPHKSDGDIYQRGGDVLIDPDGIIRLHHVGEGPADRPSVDSLLKLVASRSPRMES
jgi:alkyl hydroperoxide reductase subunit AhpC